MPNKQLELTLKIQGTDAELKKIVAALNAAKSGAEGAKKPVADFDKGLGDVDKSAARAEQTLKKLRTELAAHQKDGGKTAKEIKKVREEIDKLASGSHNPFEGFHERIRTNLESPLSSARVQLSGMLDTMGKGPAIIAGVAVGLGLLATKAVEAVREMGAASQEIKNFATRVGVEPDQAVKLVAAGKIVGVNAEILAASSRLIANALDDEAGAGAKAAKALNRLGIDTIDLTGRQRESGDILLEVLDKLSKVENQAQRVAIAQQLLGRGSKELLPLIEDYDRLKKAVADIGVGFDDADTKLIKGRQELEKIDLEWEEFKKHVAAGIEPVVINVTRFITDVFTGKGIPGLITQIPALDLALLKASLSNKPGEKAPTEGLNPSFDALLQKNQKDAIVARGAKFSETSGGSLDAKKKELETVKKEVEALRTSLSKGAIPEGVDSFKEGEDKFKKLSERETQLQAAIKQMEGFPNALKRLNEAEVAALGGSKGPISKAIDELRQKDEELFEELGPKYAARVAALFQQQKADKINDFLKESRKKLAESASQGSKEGKDILDRVGVNPDIGGIDPVTGDTIAGGPGTSAKVRNAAGELEAGGGAGLLAFLEIEHSSAATKEHLTAGATEFSAHLRKGIEEGQIELNKLHEIVKVFAERDRAILARNAETQIKFAELTLGQTDPQKAQEQILNIRLRLAQEEFQIEKDRVDIVLKGDADHAEKARAEVDLKKAEAKLDEDRAKAQVEAEIQILEVRKRSLEESRNAAGKFFDAFTARDGGASLKNFYSNLAKDQARAIFQNIAQFPLDAIKHQLGDIGKKSGLGGLLRGTVFDQANANQPLDKNTSALGKLTHSVDQLIGSLGGPLAPGAVAQGIGQGNAPGLSIPGLGGLQIPGLNSNGGGFENGPGSLPVGIGGASGLLSSLLGLGSPAALPSSEFNGGASSIPFNIGGGTSLLSDVLGLGGGTANFSTTAAAKAPSLFSQFLNGAQSAIGPAGLFSGFKGLSNGNDFSVQTGPGTAQTASSLGLTSKTARAGNIAASGAAVVGGALDIVGHIKQGGARGVTGAIGDAVGIAAAVDPEPISKAILAASAVAIGLVSHLFGDPKAEARKKEALLLDKQKASNFIPDNGVNVAIDSSGRELDYDFRGHSRVLKQAPKIQPYNEITGIENTPSWLYGYGHLDSNLATKLALNGQPLPPTTANLMQGVASTLGATATSVPSTAPAPTSLIQITVHAMDSKSFIDNRNNIADAVRRAVTEDHPLRSTITKAVKPF